MKKILILLAVVTATNTNLISQVNSDNPLPNYHTEEEIKMEYNMRGSGAIVNTTPPDFEVRTSAEWEEIQSLVITWASFSSILKQITYWARQECEVIIVCDDQNEVIDYLQDDNNGGDPFPDLDNITFVETGFNSIWVRDYGQHTVYQDDVGQLHLVDWIYNRNRPADNAVPEAIALEKGYSIYATTEEPYDLMATGGNWMVDGMGTAFSSELIIEENEGGFAWGTTNYPDHSLEEIEDILEQFMGIDRYIKMETLPYDQIHHIDMHMKLLDEETLIVGEYPEGVADGPQINANIEYVLSNYNSYFDDPYEVIRVQMPPEDGQYPDGSWPNIGDYRTYTNMVFVNKTVLVPIYEEEFDTPALEIIQNALPGYNIQGIDCNQIIPLSGAIHCITKAVGVDDPMLIVHQPLDDTEDDMNDYQVDGLVKHNSGINTSTTYYRVNGGDWQTLSMTETDSENDIWTSYIPAQSVGSVIDYYIEGNSVSGKTLSKPIVAPDGYWTFEVVDEIVTVEEEYFEAENPMLDIYPNPAGAITVVPINMEVGVQSRIYITDMTGRVVKEIHNGMVPRGESKYFFDASELASGMYNVHLVAGNQVYSSRLMVAH